MPAYKALRDWPFPQIQNKFTEIVSKSMLNIIFYPKWDLSNF